MHSGHPTELLRPLGFFTGGALVGSGLTLVALYIFLDRKVP